MLKVNGIQKLSDKQVVSSVFDAINRAFVFGEKNFRTIVVHDFDNKTEEIWFRGKDIAEILEYKNTKIALQTHVSPKYKKSYANLFDILGGTQITSHLKKPSFNEGLAVYIKEAGLYELIFSSKLPVAIKFKEHIFEEILPTIRKMGQKKYLDKIAELERKQLNLMSFVENQKLLEKDQVFYVMTTGAYAQNNRFEYGGVKNINEIKNRLSSYNTGRAEGDLMYICKIVKCNNYRLIEDRIGNVLQRFKDKLGSRKEMVHIRYDHLEEIVNFICEHYNCEIDFINEKCQKIFEETLNTEPIIPGAIDPKEFGDYMEITVQREYSKKSRKIDISDWSDSQINAALEEIINLCGRVKTPDYDFVQHKDHIELCLTWSDISSKIKSIYKVDNMTKWRDWFKDWFAGSGPKKLKIRGIKLDLSQIKK